VLFRVWGEAEHTSVRFRFVDTSRFDKIRHEFAVDLEPVR
jgi:hypothetical protein